MKISIIGTGYVGLVTGACFAESGHTVYCIDNNEEKIKLLNEGHIPIFEPGLEPLIKYNKEKGRIHFSTDMATGINNSDIAFIAVGTPQDEDGSADLQYVYQVCEDICKIAKKQVIIATKSTVPVGTGDRIENLFREKLNQPFVVFSNPEFLKEGDAINDFMKPDRIIIGTNDENIIPMLKDLYSPFTHKSNRLIFMSRRSAEITKYAANSMLALRISFMNELAKFCDSAKGNIHDVRIGIGSDQRIGAGFLYSGLGFGGSCFPKDIQALVRVADDHDVNLKTVKAIIDVNKNQPLYFLNKILNSFTSEPPKSLAVWGLSFKAKTDDIRYSPALVLIDHLLEKGIKVHAYDPEAIENTKLKYLDKIQYHENKLNCLKDADGLIIATDWNEFKNPNFKEIKNLLKQPKIFDGRNLYNAKKLKELGFEYIGIGTNHLSLE